MLRHGAVLLALATVAAALPVHAVNEGDPVVFYLGDSPNGAASFCGPYGLYPELGNGTGTCGQGFAVSAAGQGVAPPHEFIAATVLRNVTIGATGTAHIVFSAFANPGTYEVAVSLHTGSAPLLSGDTWCNVSAPCDVTLSGPGATLRFPDVAMTVSFPTIVGVFTPSITFGGADPSRLTMDGKWGAAYTIPKAVPLPLSALPPSGEVPLHVGAGVTDCLALALAPLGPAYCIVGSPPLFLGNEYSEAWHAPRAFNFSGSGDLQVSIAPYAPAQPTSGSVDLQVELYSVGHVTRGQTLCSYAALPATCTLHLTGKPGHIAWQGKLTMSVTATVDGPPVVLFGGADGGVLTLHNLTWQPDPVVLQQPEPVHASAGAALPWAMLLLAIAALGRRRR